MNIAPIYMRMEELVTKHLRVAPFEVTEPTEPWKSAAVETCGHLKVSDAAQVRPTKVIPRILEYPTVSSAKHEVTATMHP